MRNYIATITALAAGLVGSVLIPTLEADDFHKSIIMTINQAIDIQGTVLPPGAYMIRLRDHLSNPETVEIVKAIDNQLIATVFVTPAWRPKPTDRSEFTFYDAAEGRPPALHKWFYPGDNVGFEFRRSRRRKVAGQPPSSRANVTNSHPSQP